MNKQAPEIPQYYTFVIQCLEKYILYWNEIVDCILHYFFKVHKGYQITPFHLK